MAAADRGWAAPPLAPPSPSPQVAEAAAVRPAVARAESPVVPEAPASLTSPERLAEFFAPRSIAVVGASDTSAWARFVLASAAATGFSGELIPVHHVRRTVFGRPAVASLRDLPEPPDLAFVLVPAEAVEGVLDDAGAAGVCGAIVLASGYRETGPEGRAAEERLTARAAGNGITLLGPNCLGFLNAHAKAGPFALTVPLPLLAGPVGIALQSGALASVMLSFARSRAIGVSTLASMGNEAMITATDMVDYLIEDEHTRVICLFLEQIGDPAAFAAAAGRADRAGKPIVALKAGSSAAGSQAALAHTGSVAGDDAVVDAALRQLNVIRVTSIEDLLTTGALLGYGRPPRGRRMGVLTASGGACDIIADQASAQGIEIPSFGPATAAAIAPHVPPFAQVRNPLDVTGYFLANQRTSALTAIDHALDAAVSDPGLDFVLFSGLTLPDARPADEKLASMLDERVAWLGQRMASAPIPVIAVGSTCVDVTSYGRDLMGRNGIHLLGGMDLGVRAIGHALQWSENRGHLWPGPAGTRTLNPRWRQDDSKGSALSSEPVVWREADARGLVAEFGVPLVPGELVTSSEAAAAAAKRLGYPVALRISSPQITHKSDVGGVALGLRTIAQIRADYKRVSAAASALPHGPADPANPADHAGPAGQDSVDGVMVSAMRTGGTELLAGVTVDPAFGPVLAVGLGGIWVEVLSDIALRVLPVGPDEVIAMLGELRGAPLLRGARGRPPADLDALARVIGGIADAALSLGDSLRSLEVNPLWVNGEQIEALDVLVVTEPPGQNKPSQNRTEHRT
ncbi:MAG TPA: acetate--CoA ligase family protein [Streptosporangiaceae bacterium]|nr:acetate--CoA ligase family protein [Streptosporangiaceae bacterium]